MATDESHGQKTLYPWAGIQGPSRDPAPCFLSTFSLIFHTIPVFQRTEVTGQTQFSDLGLSVCLRAESDGSGRHRAPPSPRHTLSPVIDFTLRPTGIEVPPGPSDGRARGARSPWAQARSPWCSPGSLPRGLPRLPSSRRLPCPARLLPGCLPGPLLLVSFTVRCSQGLTFTLVLRLFLRWEDTGWQPLGLADLRPALALLRGRVVHVASGRSRWGLEVKWAPAEIVASPQTVSCLSIPAR